ncbi:hypothetical protein F4811DRAFT_533323 [Daldinia bambusicola]|nr:hypothetical protein F4811DRAFT_533323 [Daldinia bambusicola]
MYSPQVHDFFRAPSLRSWLETTFKGDDSEDESDFYRRIGLWFKPIFHSSLSRQYLDDLTKHNSWWHQFCESVVPDYEIIHEAFNADPCLMAITLDENIQTYLCTHMCLKAEPEYRTNLERYGPNNIDKHLGYILWSISGDLDSRRNQIPRWDGLNDKVRRFCLEVGCPRLVPNLFLNIDGLRKVALVVSSRSGEAVLQERIQELEAQLEKYQGTAM